MGALKHSDFDANGAPLTQAEFERIRRLAYERAGLSMSDAKRMLVEGRLRKRLQATGSRSYGAYTDLITQPDQQAELQTALDLLTTNETYFFREPQHFEHLRKEVIAKRRPGSGKMRIWSAASSSGEEAYSIAMLLADTLGMVDWQILGSDLSTSVLARARTGRYPLSRAGGIKQEYLRQYCLKGVGTQDGALLISRELRQRVEFIHLNLIETLPAKLGQFDVIFLRNVMIYFDTPTKRRVVENLAPCLKPDGYFYIGHSETLNGVTEVLKQVSPAIYRKSGV